MIPAAVMTIELFADSGIVAASLTAFIPTLPALITSPAEVMIEIFPISLLNAKTP